MKWFALVSGGILGTLARYLFGGAVYQWLGPAFPYGTLAVNLTGCWMIGLLAALNSERFLLGPSTKVFLMVGFCGAYTTFSTFMLETTNLMREGENLRAFTNLMLSVILGFIALRIGMLTAKFI